MPSKCDQKIRALTVYLGCTYTKVLYNLFFVINRILKKCEKKIKQKNELINGCICTEELINIISTLIVPMSILMKSAIDGVDLLHNKPWVILNEHRRYYYMISPLLEEIGNILDELDKRTLSRDHISTYSWALDTMDNFFKRIFINLNKESVLYCDFVPYSTNYLWKEWLQEYKAIIEKGIKSVFFKFLTGKFNDYIKTVITEKYFELGFKFDSITEETFIPTSEEPIEPGI
ncbi:uncharacterized protein LOC126908648 [Daktulosphaira vitifoliae]|uniref:uncharacterized protein LOC126908648 n=1 Tax=Daktulosphaira vitifoliae TaxID=58002 RepID=UPI0021AACA4F|nr:uncharacterized protein LOC126908648 [Daktulosphaira vitifoliae]